MYSVPVQVLVGYVFSYPVPARFHELKCISNTPAGGRLSPRTQSSSSSSTHSQRWPYRVATQCLLFCL